MIQDVYPGSGNFFPITDPDPGVKKRHWIPPPESNVCVGQERRVEVANVWCGIHVEYGRGDETRGGIPALLA
jgi:hypothetical protein